MPDVPVAKLGVVNTGGAAARDWDTCVGRAALNRLSWLRGPAPQPHSRPEGGQGRGRGVGNAHNTGQSEDGFEVLDEK